MIKQNSVVKKIVEHDTLLGDIELSYNEYGENQKIKIIRLSKILKELGHPQENIHSKVCKDVALFGIKEGYVRQVLPDEYKDLKKRNIEQSTREVCGSSAASEISQKEPILVGSGGQSIRNESGKNYDPSEIDQIYGKTFDQMRNEVDREIR